MNEKILVFFLSNWFPSQLAIFLIGIFAYFLLRNAEMRRLYRDRFWASALLVFCLLALLSLWNGGLSGFVPFDLLVALALAGVIVSLAGNAVPLVVNPFICYVGQLSYSCYLTHFIAVGLALEILHYCFGPHLLNLGSGPMVLEGGSAAMNFGLFVLLVTFALMLTILFSIVTHHLVERPGIALGKWIIRRIDEGRGVPAVKDRVR